MSYFLDQDRVDVFCSQCNIDRKAAEESGINWEHLRSLCEHYETYLSELETAGMVVTTALQSVRNVHSLKMRLKSSEHLAAKVIRKRIKEPSDDISVASVTIPYPSRHTDEAKRHSRT